MTDSCVLTGEVSVGTAGTVNGPEDERLDRDAITGARSRRRRATTTADRHGIAGGASLHRPREPVGLA